VCVCGGSGSRFRLYFLGPHRLFGRRWKMESGKWRGQTNGLSSQRKISPHSHVVNLSARPPPPSSIHPPFSLTPHTPCAPSPSPSAWPSCCWLSWLLSPLMVRRGGGRSAGRGKAERGKGAPIGAGLFAQDGAGGTHPVLLAPSTPLPPRPFATPAASAPSRKLLWGGWGW